MIRITTKHNSGKLVVSFPCDLDHVAKIKATTGRQWRPAEKHWNIPFSQGIVQTILSIFQSHDIELDASLKSPGVPPKTSRFEDLKREPTFRKYSPKTIKARR